MLWALTSYCLVHRSAFQAGSVPKNRICLIYWSWTYFFRGCSSVKPGVTLVLPPAWEVKSALWGVHLSPLCTFCCMSTSWSRGRACYSYIKICRKYPPSWPLTKKCYFGTLKVFKVSNSLSDHLIECIGVASSPHITLLWILWWPRIVWGLRAPIS